MASLLDGARTWDLASVDDPSDWEAPFEYLRPLDASLRCEICMVRRTSACLGYVQPLCYC